MSSQHKTKRNSKNSLRRKALSIAISSALVPATFIASPVSAAALEEVIVTATRRAEGVQDIPYNISAVSGDALVKGNINNVSDLGKVVPGLSVTDSGSRTGFISNSVVIRGLNGLDTSLQHSPVKIVPSVATYINDTPVFANVQFSDLQRVEVLRGPQGTLYGSGSVGGTVRYILNDPSVDEVEGKVVLGASSTTGASDANTEVEGMLNIPVSDSFALRFNAKHVAEAGTIDAQDIYQLGSNGEPVLADQSDIVNSTALTQNIKNADDGESLFMRMSALWDISDTVELKASYFRQENEADSSSNESVALGEGSGISPKLILEPFEGETDMFSAELNADLGFASFTSVSSYYDTSNKGTFDLTGQYLGFGFYPEVYGSSPRPLIVDRSERDEKAFVQEFRLVSQTDGPIDWIAGIFYMEQEGSTITEQYFPGYQSYFDACDAAGLITAANFDEDGEFIGGEPCGFGTFLGDPTVEGTPAEVRDLAYLTNFDDKFEELALFGELTYNVSDRLAVTAGARVFEQSYEIIESGGIAFANDLSVNEKNSFDAGDNGSAQALYKLNISYNFNDDHKIYATYSEGQRRGGANALGPLGTPDILTFKPDVVENTEIGLKGTFNDNVEYTIAIFNMDWSDIQIRSNCTDLALICTVNAGDAEVYGLEFELNTQITDSLQARMGFTYLDTELNDPAQSESLGFVEGVALAGAAENSGNISLIYGTELNNNWGFDAFLNAAYVDTRTGNLANIEAGEQTTTLDSYTVVDANISLSYEGWTTTLFLDNIFDDDTWISQADPGLWQTGAYAGIQRPFTLGLSVAYTF